MHVVTQPKLGTPTGARRFVRFDRLNDNEGVVVQLLCDPTSAHDVAYAVAGILVRLGVKTLEGA